MLQGRRSRLPGWHGGWPGGRNGKERDIDATILLRSEVAPARPRGVGLAAVAIALLVTCGCIQPVGPARTSESYRAKATTTAEAGISAAESASLVIDGADEERLLPPYTAVLLSELEDDAGGAASTFSGIQPPSAEADRVRADLLDRMADLQDALAELRIDARRGDLEALADVRPALRDAVDQLEAFVEEQG